MSENSNNNIDFLERIVDLLNEQNYYSMVVSPMLEPGNSIALMALPGTGHHYYYDGSYRMEFNFQVSVKHKHQMTGYQTLQTMTTLLEGLNKLNSNNDSFQFEEITTTTVPHVIGEDEDYYYYGAIYKADLFIKNKR